MVGIVVVSHSAKVAEGVREIALQMAGPAARLAVAGGNPQGGIGTDAGALARALAAVDSPDGVLVLVDLGSAVMTAQLVIEGLPEEARGRVVIANAPLVEGALVAAVTAAAGLPLAEVRRAAEEAATLPKA
jgi:dihydroxyacetone kinase phosphotransfer subunit